MDIDAAVNDGYGPCRTPCQWADPLRSEGPLPGAFYEQAPCWASPDLPGLLEDARRELAHHYLLYSDVELKEAGYLLGYEDANSFFRAFHGWEGVPPGRWRTRRRKSMLARPADWPSSRRRTGSQGISWGIRPRSAVASRP